MKIEAVHLRRYRGLQSASLEQCAGLNVLIGRNNAGKSSVLAAIETALDHLRSGKIAAIWKTRNRPIDEFTSRDNDKSLQIGIEFEADFALIEELRERIISSGAGLEVAAKQLADATKISIILAGITDGDEAIMYVEGVAIGSIDSEGDFLSNIGAKLLSMPATVAKELANRERQITTIKRDMQSLGRLDRNILEYAFREGPGSRGRRMREMGGRVPLSPAMTDKIDNIINKSENIESFNATVAELKSSLALDIDEIRTSETIDSFEVFSGSVQVLPSYLSWIFEKVSSGEVVTFKEVREAIGRDEASQILRLKTKRGGAEALARIQSTVKSLLGVQVDAFEPESPASSRRGQSDHEAEIDVDDFLIEANGAGIREALRIILDLELRNPCLAFIEEPEVHLHPGLERVLHSYLVGKSKTVQLFVATHSANFLDSSTRQNVYLVSRLEGQFSTVQKVASEGDLLKISEEVGLRPSTVLMFDRLVFVEGPSDEEILGELSRTLGLDIAASSTAFVQMGGASRFAHYAAEATLDLLSRRQVKMWFVIDKDERNDTDVTRLLDKLGNRAELTFLGRREIENYLLFPEALLSLLLEKMKSAADKRLPEVQEIDALINTCSNELLERAIELRTGKIMLKPLYAQYGGDTIAERLSAMSAAVSERIAKIESVESEIRAELEPIWEQSATKLAPGSLIIDCVFSKFGYRYRKEVDGRRLAERVDPTKIDPELVRFLKKVATVN